jgi:EmrB/QacA subfamily drug resistance transporter
MPSTSSDGAPERAGRWALVAAILASSMAFIDGSALNVALPAIQLDLRASGADLLWIINAYNLMLAALILVGGALGDRLGRKRVFMAGIVLFALASLLCGISPSTGVLIAARALQGVGGALMVPGSLALLTAFFDAGARGRAIGTWSTFTTITTILGPGLGGLLAGAGLWRLVFFINLPLAAAALAILARLVPESRDEGASGRLDIAGALLITLGLAGLTYGLIEAPGRGWGDGGVTLSLAGGGLALAAFIAVEAWSPAAMVPLRLFRSRVFSATNLLTLLLYAALSGLLFFLPLNMIQVQRYPEAVAGLATLPLVLCIAVFSRWAGALTDRFGPRLPLTLGPALAGAGFLALGLVGLTTGPQSYWWTFFPGMGLLGIGMAITVAPLTTAVMGALDSTLAGVASGVNNAVSRVAGVLAVAVLGALALASFTGNLRLAADGLGLDPAGRAALLAEAPQLGAAQPPPNLSADQTSAAREAIRQSYVATFRLIGFITAGLAWASALAAGLMLGPRRE